MKSINGGFFLFLIALLFTACEKEEAVTNPGITVKEPLAHSLHTAGDSIFVHAVMTDEEGINFIQLMLLNEDLIFKESIFSASFPVPQTMVTINQYFELSNHSLDAGVYFIQLQVKSTDGLSNAFVQINLSASRLEVEKLILVSQLNSQTAILGEIAPGGDYEKKLEDIHLHADKLRVNPLLNQIYLMSRDPGKIHCYDAYSYDELWRKEAASTYPVYTDLFVKDDMIFVSSENGEVSAFNGSGLLQFITLQAQDYVPRRFAVSDDFIVTYSERRSGSDKLIRTFYNSTGVFMQQTTFFAKAVDVFSLSNNNFLLFANTNGVSAIYLFEVESNRLKEVAALPEEIVAVTKTNAHYYLIQAEDSWYRFNASSSFLQTLSFTFHTEVVTYDLVNQSLYTSSVQKVEMRNELNGNIIWTKETQTNIADMDVLYNRIP